MKSNKKGFTLVELVVVIAIIGILAAILVPTFSGLKRSNMIKVANDNAYQVYMAVQNWLNEMDAKGIDISGAKYDFDSTKEKKARPYIYLTCDRNADGSVNYSLVGDYPGDDDGGRNLDTDLKAAGNEINRDIGAYLLTSDINREANQAWAAKVFLDTNTVDYALWTSESELFIDTVNITKSGSNPGITSDQAVLQQKREQLEFFVDVMGNKAVGCYPTKEQLDMMPWLH